MLALPGFKVCLENMFYLQYLQLECLKQDKICPEFFLMFFFFALTYKCNHMLRDRSFKMQISNLTANFLCTEK